MHEEWVVEGDLYDGGLKEIDVGLYVDEDGSTFVSPEVEKFHV